MFYFLVGENNAWQANAHDITPDVVKPVNHRLLAGLQGHVGR